MAQAVGIIPARMGSTRFPGKVLAPILGKPMVQYVWESAREAGLEEVWIATDSEEVMRVAGGFGARVVLTPADLPSGTDRVAFVAKDLPHEWVLGLQADEPLLEPAAIDLLVKSLRDNPGMEMATLAIPDDDPASLENGDVVKVVVNYKSEALYFSRAPLVSGAAGGFLRHLGVYAYRKSALLRFCGAAPGVLEVAERLEQLRALEMGFKIHVVVTDCDTMAVDRPQDIAGVEARLRARYNRRNL